MWQVKIKKPTTNSKGAAALRVDARKVRARRKKGVKAAAIKKAEPEPQGYVSCRLFSRKELTESALKQYHKLTPLGPNLPAPVTRIVAVSVVSRTNPVRSRIGTGRPVSSAPVVARPHRVIVSRHPRVPWSWRNQSGIRDHRRRRGRRSIIPRSIASESDSKKHASACKHRASSQ